MGKKTETSYLGFRNVVGSGIKEPEVASGKLPGGCPEIGVGGD